MSVFHIGNRVIHSSFGIGTVKDIKYRRTINETVSVASVKFDSILQVTVKRAEFGASNSN